MRTAPVLIHLDHALWQRRELVAREGRLVVRGDLSTPIMEGAVERVRMTVFAIMAGLLPILWSSGTGSEIMQRIAVPMLGGMVSSTVLTLIVIPGRRLPTSAHLPSSRELTIEPP